MTKLEYINDTYLFENNAKILEIGNNDFGNYIILDKTIFYPQSGGQPSDTGVIKNNNGKFQVENVRFNENKEKVFHYGNFLNGSINENEEVILNINKEKRILNAKNHSAGHLIDVAAKNIGLNSIKATKGFHFPQGCYVEYEGNLEGEKEEIINNLNIELNKLISEKIKVITDDTNLLFRQVNFNGFDGCGCGGTHVNNSSEIGKIIVSKIKIKKGIIKISYKIN